MNETVKRNGGVASSATLTDGAQRADDNDERATRPAAVAVMIRVF